MCIHQVFLILEIGLIKNKFKKQKGLSIIEAITASTILAVSVIVFMTLQSEQEKRFTLLRKFDKAAYAVDLVFEELNAVYAPKPNQYGDPVVFQNTNPSGGSTQSIVISALTSVPEVGDRFVIAGVPGTYEITAATSLTNTRSTLTVKRSDIPDTSPNLSLASNAVANAKLTFTLNANGSLDPYDDLDLLKYQDSTYKSSLSSDLVTSLEKWGDLLNNHLGRALTDDKRLIEVDEVTVNIPVDDNNDGVTDQVSGVDQFTSVNKTQVTITIKQDNITEIFRRHYTNGS
ncbi:type IV pilus modification PilV family protein [Candidatus Pelagibacter sp. HIMB109]|uniref:type IV pilus modification PilV family protein n=1 Tax=Candidatus Pelagibacter sp. HIMB109 TaxID=3415412 RepID=UPI003F82CFF6